MKKAYLDCVNKTLKVEIANETFTFKLEGSKLEAGSVRTKLGVFVTNFQWKEDKPYFRIIDHNTYVTDLQKGFVVVPHTLWEDYNVIIDMGSKEDYFGVSFPQGINSYLFAYGIIVREVNSGSVDIYEKLQKIAFEWEEKTIGWDWEDKIYEEELIDFLHTHKFLD